MAESLTMMGGMMGGMAGGESPLQLPSQSQLPLIATPRPTEVIKELLAAYRDSQSTKSDFMRNAVNWYKAYNVYLERPTKKKAEELKRARISTPQLFSVVEFATARMKTALFSQPIVVRALPMEETDVEAANLNELLINYQLQQSNIRLKGEIWLRNWNIYGITPVYTYWRTATQRRIVRLPIEMPDPFTGQLVTLGMGPPQEMEVIIHDGPDFDVGDIEDFFPDSAARSFLPEDLRWVIRRYYRSYESILQEVQQGKFDPAAFLELKPDETPPPRDDYNFSDTKVREITLVDRSAVGKASKGVFELLEFMSANEIVTMANRRVLLRQIPNFYWHGEIPCIVSIRLPITNYPWGKGQIEPIEKTHAHLNALRNARLDNINRVLNPPMKGRRNAVDKTQLKFDPNNLIELADLADLEVLQIPDVTQTVYIEENILKQDIDLASSQFGVSKGETSPSVRSATHQLAIMEVTNERLQMDIDAFTDTGLKRLAKHYHSLNQQFITREKVVRVTGVEEGARWLRVHPQEVWADLDFHIEAAAKIVPRAIEAQQRLGFVNSIMPLIMEIAPDAAIRLYRQIAKDIGYLELSRELGQIAKLLEFIRMMGQLPSQVRDEAIKKGQTNGKGQGKSQGGGQGGGKQRAQAERGKLGANSSPENTASTPEQLIEQVINQIKPAGIQ